MQATHATQFRAATHNAVAALVSTARLPAVAAEPVTPILPAVATEPATAMLPPVATEPATARLPPVAIDPATAALSRVASEPVTGRSFALFFTVIMPMLYPNLSDNRTSFSRPRRPGKRGFTRTAATTNSVRLIRRKFATYIGLASRFRRYVP